MPPLTKEKGPGDWYTHLHYLSQQIEELKDQLSSFREDQREREDELKEKLNTLQARSAIIGFIAGAIPVVIALMALILKWRGG